MSTKFLESAYLVGRAGCAPLVQTRPADQPRVMADGPDPIRVLVTGAGLAAGYGVTRWNQTLAGSLVRRISAASGRGVVLDVRAAPLLRAAAAVHHIGAAGTHSYHAAIFAPCHFEASFAPRSGIVRHALAIQEHLLGTGSPTLQVAMLGLPRPDHFSRLDLAAVRAATAGNRALQKAAERSPRVVYVPTAPYRSVRDPQPFGALYYAALGNDIADLLVPALGYRTETRPRS